VAWILDLDGVVWLMDEPITGAPEAVGALRDRGERVLFLTNNSSATVAEYLARLRRIGIPAAAGDLLSSAVAAVGLLEPGSKVLVCAGPGVEEALASHGMTPVRAGPADAVVVGWHTDFDYGRLTAAFRAVHAGARLIGTNDDPTYPTPEGPLPGGGSILAAVATAASVTPEVAGKPHEPMAALVRARLGADLAGSVLVGDRPSTDGLMARRLGVQFALVLSGVVGPRDLPVEPEPDAVAADLLALVETLPP
jgi:glycerol 3-phosphatase-2